MLADQDARDQEAREHEEGVHADESAGHQRGAAVVTEDERDGQRPHPVERRVVRKLAFGDLCAGALVRAHGRAKSA